MQKIFEGVLRFRDEIFPQKRPFFQRLARKQSPQALFITCADSRIVPDLITQTEPGDLFLCRNAGNIVPPYGELMGGVSATIEYAVTALAVKNIIICGHSNCGAMTGVLHPEKLHSMPTVASWLRHADVARRVVEQSHSPTDEEAFLQLLTAENVVAQLAHLRTHPSVAAKLAAGELDLHGWIYSIETGEICMFDESMGEFLPLQRSGRFPNATPRPRKLQVVA